MKRAFQIKQIKSGIFLFEFKHQYDLAMHFLRYQEFYECPSPKFRGKSFEIFDYMRWYSIKYGKGSFTYPHDWSGFNLFDGNIIKQVHDLGITDRNLYDYEMLMACNECNAKANGSKFSIIGVVKGNNETLRHEIAHAFFAMSPEYKREMIRLVKALTPSYREQINKGLKEMGYATKVLIDETQAYLATGLIPELGDVGWEYKPFVEYYKEFSRSAK